MLNKSSRLDRLSLWGTGVKAGLAAIAASFMLSTLSPVSAQQPTPEAPPTVEAPVTAPADAAAPPADAAPVEPVVEEAAPVEEEAAPVAKVYEQGNLTWMLVSTILVLMMIVPGLALFYGGLIRTKKML